MWLKSMIERCIQRARQGDCATCDHRDNCAAHRWQDVFAAQGGAAAIQPRQTPFGGGRANPLSSLLGELAKAVETHLKPRQTSVRREVERRLEPLLAGGDVSIDRVARELGLSRQTLYRRLKAENATFEHVLDSLRHKLALRYLGKEGLGVKQAAYRLGFSDPAAFSRAFKRWTGVSPSEFRGAA